ncbi:porin [uncultured Ramlibacter sp.]|uniref:porin n=1 Tax=uncultured Ramlibacter sp. TaxID=260755 RepID=UPI0026162F54|nr:porin [uncultured Ramlibacter sp.]
MKKLGTLALAVLPLGAAFAQVGPNVQGPVTGGVTLFGVVDAALAWGSGSDADRLRLVSGANTSSRLGFRAFDDLGGGTFAGIWLEAGVNTDDGTGSASNSNNQPTGAGAEVPGRQGLMFNRRSTASLMGSWGELRVGRDYVSTFRNRDQVDPFGTVGVGTNQADVSTLMGVTATRASNMIGYFLPSSLGGFFGEAQLYMGENLSGTATDSDGNGYQARLGYVAGPWGIAAAYGLTKYATTASTGDASVWNIAGHYSFDFGTLSAGYYEDKIDRTTELTGKGFLIGGRFPIGKWELKTSYSQFETDAAGDPRTSKFAIGGVYSFSKRTQAYLTYAHADNNGAAAVALNGSTTGLGRNSDGFDIGLKHSF